MFHIIRRHGKIGEWLRSTPSREDYSAIGSLWARQPAPDGDGVQMDVASNGRDFAEHHLRHHGDFLKRQQRNLSEIQGAHTLFNGAALDSMGVDHRCPDVTMPKQFLNRSDVVIGLQQVAGKTVAEGVGSRSFTELSCAHRSLEGLAQMRLMQVVPSMFTRT